MNYFDNFVFLRKIFKYRISLRFMKRGIILIVLVLSSLFICSFFVAGAVKGVNKKEIHRYEKVYGFLVKPVSGVSFDSSKGFFKNGLAVPILNEGKKSNKNIVLNFGEDYLVSSASFDSFVLNNRAKMKSLGETGWYFVEVKDRKNLGQLFKAFRDDKKNFFAVKQVRSKIVEVKSA